MLLSLDIQDFGLIDGQTIAFTPGLNVLTGETGTGKSIIIEALQLALGGRARSEFIRTGRERARVTAMFDIGGLPAVEQLLLDAGIPLEEDGTLILSRELAASGRHTCRINGQVVTLGTYREAALHLVDIHGQHENQSLFNPDVHRDLLDRFGGLWPLREEVAALYRQWQKVKTRLEDLRRGARDRLQRMDMLAYHVEEIDRAQLSPGEDEELVRERNRLANAEKIAALAARSYAALHGGEDGFPGVLDLLGQASRDMDELGGVDAALLPLAESLHNVLYQVEDVCRELSQYRDGIEYNPERLQLVEERLSRIRELKRKYGDSVEEILHYRQEAAAELEALQSGEENAAALEEEAARREREWQEKAGALSAARRRIAGRLQEDVTRELADLEMGRVNFQVLFEELPGPAASGRDRVEFLISPNPGEPLKPLARIASGGELSRIMLATRSILAAVDELPTLVFDEVDTGIGGRTLQAVAEKLASIALSRQVICVTHSVQIASFARTHWRIFKQVENGQTCTRVEMLDKEGRLAELARMLGGREVDGLAMDHARYLLEKARGMSAG
ncbi:DNA repair protein RecN [Desulfofundulus thermobenzoicus]|uniref:DNA repair protein RecN n=1 Tax=Desulfofundulus thermobenzoicus TaxID=29376 RepID=A0A6N7IR72_9FIRM|nr:DNA repair protein RecN [Desulfofundulus thermobenzoicus]MQL52083.1 DNA repair protein RecN [Desulfofundulus thermobenzoicus]